MHLGRAPEQFRDGPKADGLAEIVTLDFVTIIAPPGKGRARLCSFSTLTWAGSAGVESSLMQGVKRLEPDCF